VHLESVAAKPLVEHFGERDVVLNNQDRPFIHHPSSFGQEFPEAKNFSRNKEKL
jgi:hypothetical protein